MRFRIALSLVAGASLFAQTPAPEAAPKPLTRTGEL